MGTFPTTNVELPPRLETSKRRYTVDVSLHCCSNISNNTFNEIWARLSGKLVYIVNHRRVIYRSWRSDLEKSENEQMGKSMTNRFSLMAFTSNTTGSPTFARRWFRGFKINLVVVHPQIVTVPMFFLPIHSADSSANDYWHINGIQTHRVLLKHVPSNLN